MSDNEFGLLFLGLAIALSITVFISVHRWLGLRWFFNLPVAMLVGLWGFLLFCGIGRAAGLIELVHDPSKATFNVGMFALGWYVTAYHLNRMISKNPKA